MTTQLPTVAEWIAAIEASGPPVETRPEATTEALVALYPELASVSVEDVTIDGPHGDVPARTYIGAERTGKGLLWLHGGAWVAGTLDMPEAHWVAMTIAAAGIGVVSADYRKALHGVRYPVPSDDALAAWSWAWDNLDADVMCIGGASAGANIATGVAKRLRDGAGPVPAGVVLAYPLLHPELPPFPDAFKDVLAAAPEGTFIFSRTVVRELAANYAGDALDDPYAFAANGDVSGFPPTLIVDSEFDSLRASGEAFAAALAAAGVEVTSEMEPETVHGHLDSPAHPHGTRTLERFIAWLRHVPA